MTVHVTTGLSVLRQRIAELMPVARTDLADLVSFPSVADPVTFPPDGCRDAARWLVDAFRAVGLSDVATYGTSDGGEAVFGQFAAPPGAPTVLLYSHYDVQPPLDDTAWLSPPFELTERGARWYGRGAADCKGNIATHLMALRAFDGHPPVGVKVIAEGSEELGAGGLADFVPRNADLLRADAILVCNAGNFAVGVPTLTTTLRGLATVDVSVRSLATTVHSGIFGGPAPDALAALIRMLDSLRDDRGGTTIRGLRQRGRWAGIAYPAEQFRIDASVPEDVKLLGTGSVADELWARPAVTVLGIDCPAVLGSSARVPARVRARISLRVPPGTDARVAQDALVEHLYSAAPWQVQVTVEPVGLEQPFAGSTSGPAFEAMRSALELSYGAPLEIQGHGGSIPLCTVLKDTYPEASIMIIGVAEPLCLVHAPNESVDPTEIERIALAEALFMAAYSRPPTAA
jgi:acetylornithine deacetylase/succinyl-diaminopimelate desuccinylase-like protein